MKKLIYIILLSLPCLAWGITHSVKQDGSGDYTAIQAALDACSPGDTVLVYPGRYYENLTIQTNGISLISLEALTGNEAYIDSTIVDGNHTGRCIQVNQHVHSTLMRGFSMTNGFTTGGAGGIALPMNSSGHLENLKIFANKAYFGGGINIGAATVYLSGVIIHDNYALISGGGLYAAAGGGYINNITFDPVNRCSIYNNRSGSGQDIFIQNAYSDLNVYLDTFSVAEPTTYYAIYRSEGLNNYQMQIAIQNAHHQEIDSDLYVSPVGDDANDGLSPASPLKTIHEAIYRIAADSLSQNTVHLLPGTYSRTDNNQVFPIALKSWTILQGGGMDNTEVIGSPHPLIPAGYGSADTVFMSYREPVVSLMAFSVTTENSDNNCIIHGSNKGSLNLANIRIHDTAPDYFSLIWMYLDNEHESVWNNVVIENINTPNMGLVDINRGVSGSFTNCKFRNATSTFSSTSVWAYPLISIRGDGNLSFDNCEFSNLTISDDNSHPIQIVGVQFPQQRNNFSFKNCLFSNNTSQGGIVLVGSKNNPNVSFFNCTFAGNESDSFTLATNGNVSITNSIFYNDSPYQIKVNPMSDTEGLNTFNIRHSLISNGISGIQQAAGNTIYYPESNISGNPLFLGGDDIHDPLYYSLGAGSPCINSGILDTLGLFLLPYDLAGNQRVWDGRIDMGCFEFGAPPVGNDDPSVPAVPVFSLTAYPNPFSVFTNIIAEIPARGDRGAKATTTARIVIYNLRGQIVKNLELDPGARPQVLTWDGRDSRNQRCSNGVYILSMVVDGRSIISKKVTLIR